MAVRDLNAGGGIAGRRVKLVSVDDATNPARSAIMMRRLAIANVDIVIGGWGSSQVFAHKEIAEQSGLPYIIVGATHPQIVKSENKWTFRVIHSDRDMARILAEVAVQRLGLRRIAIISARDAYGLGSRDAFVSSLASLGLRLTAAADYGGGEMNFTAQIDLIRAGKPDGLAIFGTLPTAAAVMNEARAMGVTAQFLGTGGLANSSLMVQAPEAAEGTILTGLFDEFIDPEAAAWARRYRKEFAGIDPDPQPALAAWEYRAIRYIAAPCLAGAGQDRAKLRNCIAGWRGPMFGVPGAVGFDKTGQLVQPPVILEVRSGIFRSFGARP